MIKHLLWDLDGTLFDTYPAFIKAFLIALAEHGHSPKPEFVQAQAQIGLSHCAKVLASTYQLSLAVIEQSFGQHYAQIPLHQQPLMPGTRAICAAISAAGGLNMVVTHRSRRTARGLLETHGLWPLIDDLITGEDGFPKKPNPASMLAIMERNDILPDEALAIGDRGVDIEAGQAAGLRTCLLGSLETTVQPDFHLSHLDELLPLVQQSTPRG